MDEEQPPKKIRKGAKSCTECQQTPFGRRRKIRCVWLSPDALVCRRCEERGSECVPQVFSSQPVRPEVSSSRERIARLEQQVGSLISIVNKIQHMAGEPLVPDAFVEHNTVDGGLSDEESDDPDEPEAHPPSYLATLFNNNVLSTGEQTSGSHRPKEPYSKVLADRARENLQKLIPLKYDVEYIAGFASNWLFLYQTLFPTQAVAQTEVDIVAKYAAMKESDIDPTALATWLVTVAITIQQMPSDNIENLSGIRKPLHYTRAVSDAVDKNIIAHDSLMGTMGGIHAALHFVRLQAGHANFKKIWLTMRRITAISELIGLPRTVRFSSATSGSLNAIPDDALDDSFNSRRSKADTWISICTLDRVLCMMCNLPLGTGRYPLPSMQIDVNDSQSLQRSYLRNLADIASKVQELDDLRIAGGSDDEIYTEVLKVDRDLISLASSAPKEWWQENNSITELPLQLLPYWHYYITLRTHLLLTLQRDDNHRFDYSRSTCMNACQQTLVRFLRMRPMLTGGFFLGRMLDLQSLTAAIVLLLSYHAAKSDVGFHFQNQTVAEPSNLIMQVIAVMEDTMQRKSSDFARQAVPTLRSLKLLLEGDRHFQAKDLTLRVPLLGKIHVRKKTEMRNETSDQAERGFQSRSTSSFAGFNNNLSSPATPHLMSSENSQRTTHTDDWDFNPFTWFIEDDRESAFKDALQAEDFSHFESPFDYDNFQFAT